MRENLIVEEISLVNLSFLTEAANHFTEGGLLIIFPSGGRDFCQPWYNGIGRIFSQLPPESSISTSVIPIKISGLSRKVLWTKFRVAAQAQAEPVVVNIQKLDRITFTVSLVGCAPQVITSYLQCQVNRQLKLVTAVGAAVAAGELLPATK